MNFGSIVDGVSLASAARDVFAVACFRALPIVGFVLATRQIRIGPKLVVGLVAVLTGGIGQVWVVLPLGWLLVVYGYFVIVGALVPLGVPALRSGMLTRSGLFAASAGSFLILPGLFAPESVRTAALLIGWDLALSAYSYAAEVTRSNLEPERSDCLFFLLVNPALVYAERGERFAPPALEARGVARTGLGILTLFAASALLAPACAWSRERAFGGPHTNTALALGAYAVLRFLLEYARHAGLASLQIGALRQLGHAVPERYRLPILARNPLDFWQRWNTYVAGWLSRYVFAELVSRLARTRSRGRTMTYALSVLGTFMALGLLHDVAPYFAGTGRVGLGVAAFLVMGTIVVAWTIVSRLLSRAMLRADAAWSMLFQPVLARASFWVVALGCATWLLG